MTALELNVADNGARLGMKGPRAAEWLTSQDLVLPVAPNTWSHSPGAGREHVLVARLGQSEFFLQFDVAGSAFRGLSSALAQSPSGVYPVLREDFAFMLGGAAVHEALAQVCNVNFAALELGPQPVIMTLMIGVAVLVVPEEIAGARRYRVWCDPTFGPSLSETLGAVIVESGGIIRGVSE